SLSSLRPRGFLAYYLRRTEPDLFDDERRVEIHAYAVWIAEQCVALAPEGVPRLFLAFETGVHDSRIDLIDLGWARALKGERHLVSVQALPIRKEAADDFFGVEHQPSAIRHRGFHVVFCGNLGQVETKQTIKLQRAPQIGHRDTDCVQLRHNGDVTRWRPLTAFGFAFPCVSRITWPTKKPSSPSLPAR